jgi:radical SAM superfamily enzyme YgiQ (UPF0313 family)
MKKNIQNMKIALLFPKLTVNTNTIDNSFWFSDAIKKIIGFGKTNYTPPMSLLMLAAVTPPGIEVLIIDERLEDINFNLNVDLVGITVVTRIAYHAYDIADRFRKQGVSVVLGGIHPTLLPFEALQHANSVVRGEGEGVWPQLLHDFSEGTMKRIYEAKQSYPLDIIPAPPVELLRHSNLYLTTKVIMATRGCPYGCTFCSAGTSLGKKYRMRPINNVIKEAESTSGRILLFLDDNLGVHVDYAKDLLSALKALHVKWFGSMSVNALEDENLLKLVAESGCVSLGVGFESISRDTLHLMGKTHSNNPDHYKHIIKRLHYYHIPIAANFIIGYDTDTPAVINQLADFIEETSIEMPYLYILLPYPGTSIFHYLEREGRILHRNWNQYDTLGPNVIFRPSCMTSEELIENYFSLKERIFGYRSILNRLLKLGYCDPVLIVLYIHQNYQGRQSLKMQRASYSKNSYMHKLNQIHHII